MPTATENPLGLRIPEQAADTGNVMVRPREIEEWIATLPMASGTESGKRLFRAIQDINRTQIPAPVRIQIADLLNRPIGYAIRTLEQKFINTTFPLSEKARRTAHVCARLNEELAFAYKIAIHDTAMGKIGSAERKILIIALFHAVRHLTEMIYNASLVYMPFPRHIWRELHNLFVFAETNRWASTRVKAQVDDTAVVSTLKETYIKALLFAAASPYRMRQLEIKTLWQRLPDWVPQAKLGTVVNSMEGDTRFIVELRKDQPAQHISLVQPPVQKPCMEIDTRDLMHGLHGLFESLPISETNVQTGTVPGELSRNGLRRIMQAWSSAPRRRFVRTQLHFDLEVAVGLSTIYTLISGETDRNAGPASFGLSGIGSNDVDMDLGDLNPESTFSTELLDSESGLTLVPLDGNDNMFFHGGHHGDAITFKESAPPPSIWQKPRERDYYTSSTLITLNESAGGYCVNWRAHGLPGIKLGELVGIQAPDNPSSYGLTIVRWMRNSTEEGLTVGLQLLAPSAYAVTATDLDKHGAIPNRCLLVPELKSAERPASLVAPVMPFKVDSYVRIRRENEERTIRLVRLLEATGAFAQFQFEYD